MSEDKNKHIYGVKSKGKIVCPKCNEIVSRKFSIDNHPLFIYLCEDCIKGVTDKYFYDLVL